MIFDFDGTLADTAACIVETVQETLRQLGLPEADPERVKGTIGLHLREVFRQGADVADPEMVARCDALYRKIFPDIASRTVSEFPGVAETLAELHRRGYTLTVATGRGHDSLHDMLRRLAIDQYFTTCVACEDVANQKPNPDLAQLVLERTGTAPEDALVIGDTTFDILMGQAAGCHTAAVTYGNHTADQLAAVRPTHQIDSFSELLGLL